MSNIDYSSKEYYLKTWYNLMKVFIDWSEANVNDWVNGELTKLHNFDDPNDIVYAATPMYWAMYKVAYVKFGDAYLQKLVDTNKGAKLLKPMFAVFRDFNVDNRVPFDTNWKPYKNKIDAYIALVKLGGVQL